MLEGCILLLRADGYEFIINDCAFLHADLHILTLGREANRGSSYDGEQDGDGSILKDSRRKRQGGDVGSHVDGIIIQKMSLSADRQA